MNDVLILPGHTYVCKGFTYMHIIEIDYENNMVKWCDPRCSPRDELNVFENSLASLEAFILFDTTVSHKPLPEPEMWDFIKI